VDPEVQMVLNDMRGKIANEDPWTHYKVVGEIIAKGAFGEVNRVTEGSKEFALKRINLNGNIKEYPILLEREIRAMKTMSHPNLIDIKEAYHWNLDIFLLMELVQGQTLLDYIKSRGGKLPERDTAKILKEILLGVKYIHSKNWIHRDLKPQNIMIDATDPANFQIKIIDLGVCNQLAPGVDARTAAFTENYGPPEVIR
jgi:serine/threonine protein kinase